MKSTKESVIIEKEAINFTSIQNVDFNILYKVLNHPMCRLPLKNIFIDQVIKTLEEKTKNRAIIERVIMEKANEGEKLAHNSRALQSKTDDETNIENDDTQNKDRSEAEKEAAKISRELDKLLDFAQEKINEHDIAIKAAVSPKDDVNQINSKIKEKEKTVNKKKEEIKDSEKNENDAKKSAEEAKKKEEEARKRAEEQLILAQGALEQAKKYLPEFELQKLEADTKNAKAAQDKEKEEADKQKKDSEENEEKITKEIAKSEKAQAELDEAKSKIEDYEKEFEKVKEYLPEFELQKLETVFKNAKAVQDKEKKEADKQKKAAEENEKKIKNEIEKREKAQAELDKAKSEIEDYEKEFEKANESLKELEAKKKQAEKEEQEARMKIRNVCDKYLETVKNNFAKKYIPLLSYIDFSAASLDQLRSLSQYDEDNIYVDLNHFLKIRESELNYNQKNFYIRNQQKKLISNSLKYQQENDDFLIYIQTKKEEIERNKIELMRLQDELKQSEKDLVISQNENDALKQKTHLTNWDIDDGFVKLNKFSKDLDDDIKKIEDEISKYKEQIENQNENIKNIEIICQIKAEYLQVSQEYMALYERYVIALHCMNDLKAEKDIITKKAKL